jgi:CheY-like chemotaxis protein
MVIEDNYDAADSLVQLLEVCGHNAKAAYTAEEALALLGSYSPDLIFMDIGLPDMDGYQLARRIRRSHTELILIALTGYCPDSTLTRAAGFNQQITKPIMLDSLTALLETQAA